MTYRAVKQCPGCGWCYDPLHDWDDEDYPCCPKCGHIGNSYAWPVAVARRVWTPVWYKPWTWMRREWRPKAAAESAARREGADHV